MARAPRTGGMIPRVTPSGPTTLMNFHNFGVTRAVSNGNPGSGFTVEFLGTKAAAQLDDAIGQGVIAIRGTSIAAVVSSTDELKQKMRSFLDSHYTGSAMHGNNHRRVSNASVQSVVYDDISDKGQFSSLIYSKFGYRGPTGFVDFLLLHVRGGTVKPQSGDWLRIPTRDDENFNPQTGNYPISGSDIFFTPSKDGKKLFQMRRYAGYRAGKRAGTTRLLATLVKSLAIKPSLQGLEAIMSQRGALFHRHFDQEWARRAEGMV